MSAYWLVAVSAKVKKSEKYLKVRVEISYLNMIHNASYWQCRLTSREGDSVGLMVGFEEGCDEQKSKIIYEINTDIKPIIIKTLVHHEQLTGSVGVLEGGCVGYGGIDSVHKISLLCKRLRLYAH